MKGTLMQTTMSRTRRSSTLGPAQTSEAEEDREEGEAVTVHVSASEAMANANSTRTNKGWFKKESLRVVLHMVPLSQRRLHPPQDWPTSNHHKPLMGSLMYDVSTATRQDILQHFAIIRIGEGGAQTLQIKALSVGNP